MRPSRSGQWLLWEAQVTAFQTVWCSNTATGIGESCTPPYHTPPNEETPHRIHAQLGDLNDNELRQLIRDLLQEIAQCETIAPPSYPPPRDWACPVGNPVIEEDDQEVTFPGGGRVPTGTTTTTSKSCTGRARYEPTYKCSNVGFANRHPKN